MSYLRNILSALGFLAVAPVSAHAQLLPSDIATTPQAGQTYVSLGGINEADSAGCYVPTGFCVNARGININTIARAPDVNNQFGIVNSQLTGLTGQLGIANALLTNLTGQLGTTNTQLANLTGQFSAFSAMQTSTNDKLFDLVAISAALKDAVPNEGDRFAVRVNLGGFQNNLAGGISGTARLNDSTRFSAGFGHGSRQSLFNAGLNFSFN